MQYYVAYTSLHVHMLLVTYRSASGVQKGDLPPAPLPTSCKC